MRTRPEASQGWMFVDDDKYLRQSSVHLLLFFFFFFLSLPSDLHLILLLPPSPYLPRSTYFRQPRSTQTHLPTMGVSVFPFPSWDCPAHAPPPKLRMWHHHRHNQSGLHTTCNLQPAYSSSFLHNSLPPRSPVVNLPQ